jgi:phospholipase/lecithinase/hemolysin
VWLCIFISILTWDLHSQLLFFSLWAFLGFVVGSERSRQVRMMAGALTQSSSALAAVVGAATLCILVLSKFAVAAGGASTTSTSLVPAVYIFGDSTVDTGNQKYLTTVITSDYPPYGRDFVPPGPTGRFSNGKLANDFGAERLGLPYAVNYLDQSATVQNYLQGVNFASSGSGYLNITGYILGVETVDEQLAFFRKVKEAIIASIGVNAAEEHMQKSFFLMSTGSNDFINLYNIDPIIQAMYTPAQYEDLLISTLSGYIQALYSYGARKIAVDSLAPLGCVPQQVGLFSKAGECVDSINEPVISFNAATKNLLTQLSSTLPGSYLVYFNTYDPIYEARNNPAAYGFQYGKEACCGSGSYSGLSPCTTLNVCNDSDAHVFWDLFHPTEKMYGMLAVGYWSGPPSLAYPYNLQQLVTF